MDLYRQLIPYDIHYQYVTKSRREIFHSYKKWGSELVIILNGSATYRINNHRFPIIRGDIFLHTGDYTKEIYDANKLTICSIFFHDEHIERSTALFRHMLGYQKFFVENPLNEKGDEQYILHTDESFISEIEQLLSAMSLEYQHTELGSEQVLNSLFFVLITLISRAYSKDIMINSEPENSISEVVSYIRLHYTENITVEHLASIAFLSPRHFNRKFKDIFKTTPIQYINKLRLQHACHLLEQSNLTISEIAMKCGFSDINYFSKNFKRHYDDNPSNYRKKYMSSISNPNNTGMRPE